VLNGWKIMIASVPLKKNIWKWKWVINGKIWWRKKLRNLCGSHPSQVESVCQSTVCNLNTDAASRHLGKCLKSNLETKQSTCACLVVNIRKKLSFISRRVRYVKTLCITCNLISDKNVCEEDPPVIFSIFKYLQSSSFLLWGELWAETCNSFVGCDIFSSRSTSKILGGAQNYHFHRCRLSETLVCVRNGIECQKIKCPKCFLFACNVVELFESLSGCKKNSGLNR